MHDGESLLINYLLEIHSVHTLYTVTASAKLNAKTTNLKKMGHKGVLI